MTIRETMNAWLTTGTSPQREHARLRLALLDGPPTPVGYVNPPPQPPPPPPSPRGLAAHFAAVRALNPPVPLPAGMTCLYAEPASFGGSLPIRCWAARGCNCGSGRLSDAAHCARCLKGPSSSTAS